RITCGCIPGATSLSRRARIGGARVHYGTSVCPCRWTALTIPCNPAPPASSRWCAPSNSTSWGRQCRTVWRGITSPVSRPLRKALRPLRQARQELAEWQAGQRLQLSDQVPQELLPLVQEVNHLGAQLERIIQRARKGVGDLSHGLKTPLAVVERLLIKEVLDAGDREVLRQQIEQIRRQLERALQRARLAPERQLTRRFSAAEDLPWLCTSVQQAHGERVRIEHPDLQGETPWPFE